MFIGFCDMFGKRVLCDISKIDYIIYEQGIGGQVSVSCRVFSLNATSVDQFIQDWMTLDSQNRRPYATRQSQESTG